MSYKEANDVLNYWFGGGDRSKRPRWFGGGEEAAQELRDKFGTLVSEDVWSSICHATLRTLSLYFVNLSSSGNSYPFILFQLQCIYCVYYPLNIFPTQGIRKSGNRGLLNISARAFHKLLRNFLAKFWYFESLFSF